MYTMKTSTINSKARISCFWNQPAFSTWSFATNSTYSNLHSRNSKSD